MNFHTVHRIILLFYIQADVLVSSAVSNLNNPTMVGRVLNSFGGSSYMAACSQHTNIGTGDIATTIGGNLACSYVIHAVCCGWTSGGRAEQVRNIGSTCLHHLTMLSSTFDFYTPSNHCEVVQKHVRHLAMFNSQLLTSNIRSLYGSLKWRTCTTLALFSILAILILTRNTCNPSPLLIEEVHIFHMKYYGWI
jgi:hypothetical protein